MDLNTIYAQLTHWFGPLAPMLLVVGWLIDRKGSLHLAAQALRWIANVLDAAPKVAADVKAGDVRKAVQDAQGGPTP